MSTYLYETLRKGQFAAGLAYLLKCYRNYSDSELTTLIEDAPAAIRPKLVALLRDVISEYPHIKMGAPLLVYWKASPGQLHVLPQSAPNPATDLKFLGWQQRVTTPRHHTESVTITANTCTALLALFETTAEACETDSIQVPNAWWADALGFDSGQVEATARLLLPSPDATEACALQQALIKSGQEPPHYFLRSALAKFYHDTTTVFLNRIALLDDYHAI